MRRKKILSQAYANVIKHYRIPNDTSHLLGTLTASVGGAIKLHCTFNKALKLYWLWLCLLFDCLPRHRFRSDSVYVSFIVESFCIGRRRRRNGKTNQDQLGQKKSHRFRSGEWVHGKLIVWNKHLPNSSWAWFLSIMLQRWSHYHVIYLMLLVAVSTEGR